jgi:signal transduction histidine kinase
MLDASRIEFGYEKLRCEEFDVNDVFDDLRSEFTLPPALTIRWPRASGIPPLRTDPDKLRAIVRNLVENAIKYTPAGLVTVEARWDAQRDEVEICVSDTGIGIPSAEIDGIFEAFRQGSNRHLFGKAGVGLGLYIVQRLVQRLGGEIAVDSRLDHGSTFTARIPRLLHRGDAVAADENGAGDWALGAG